MTYNTLHYAANGSASAACMALGYKIVDTSSASVAASLPAGVRALVWLGGTVPGATASFKSQVDAFKPVASKVFGFFLADGQGHTTGATNIANLKSESDYIHSVNPAWYTYVRLGNNSSSQHPSFAGGATYPNTHVDLFGIDAYPCRVGDTFPTTFTGCNLNYIDVTYKALVRDLAIPNWRIVPTFQAFGNYPGGDDSGGNWALPTATQARQIIDRWATFLPNPVFDYTYSWGVQHSDQALSTAPADLQAVFRKHNGL